MSPAAFTFGAASAALLTHFEAVCIHTGQVDSAMSATMTQPGDV